MVGSMLGDEGWDERRELPGTAWRGGVRGAILVVCMMTMSVGGK